MPQNFKAILFDMDGLMVNTEDISHEAFMLACSKLGGTFTKEIHAKILGTRSDYWSTVVAQDSMVDASSVELRDLYRSIYSELIPQRINMMPGLEEFIEWAEEQMLKIAVVTSSTSESLERNLNAIGLRDRFDVVVTAESIQNGKPAPDPYLMGANLLEVEPSSCVVLEDSVMGAESGKAAGAYVVAVPTAYTDISLFSAGQVLCGSLLEARDHLMVVGGW